MRSLGKNPAAGDSQAKPSESLLAGTDAIPRATVEIGGHQRKHLVRYRDLMGFSHRLLTADLTEANRQFLAWVDELRGAVRQEQVAANVRRSLDVWGY